MAIDWNYWLKCRTLTEIEVVLLTLGLDPESYQIGILDGHYLVNENDLKQKQKNYIMRMGVVQDYRFKSYAYMANDGEWGDYFSANNQKVIVKRFLLWLKNEDMGWDLPNELQVYIEKLNMPNQEHWAQGLVDNLNNKLTQPKVTQKWELKPGKAYPGYRLALFEFLEKEYKDGKEYPPNAYDFIAKLKQDIKANEAPEGIYVRNKGIDYITKDGVTNKADLKAINQAIDNLIIKLSKDE
jgi:hypothetical protein